MITEVHKGLAVWGQPLKIWGRLRMLEIPPQNIFGYPSTTMAGNIPNLFPLSPKTLQETQFEIPWYPEKYPADVCGPLRSDRREK